MATLSNLELFKSIVERGFSQGDLTVADEVCAKRLVEHEYLARTDLPGPLRDGQFNAWTASTRNDPRHAAVEGQRYFRHLHRGVCSHR